MTSFKTEDIMNTKMLRQAFDYFDAVFLDIFDIKNRMGMDKFHKTKCK